MSKLGNWIWRNLINTGEDGAIAGLGLSSAEPGEDLPPIALTDQHVAALERAIRAEGYDIFVDPVTGEIVLKRVGLRIRVWGMGGLRHERHK